MNPIVSNFRPVDGASLVPDYSNANKLAMGIATQIKEGKVKQAVEEESASLQTALSNQNLEDIMNDPVLTNKLLRLYNIDAGMATALLDVMKSGDAIALAREAQSTKEANQLYNSIDGLYKTEGIVAAKNALRQKIIELDVEGRLPTDKLKNLLVMPEDDFAAGVATQRALSGTVLDVVSPETVKLSQGEQLINTGTGGILAENIKPIEFKDERPSLTELKGINTDVGKLVQPATDVRAAAFSLENLRKNSSATDKLAAIFKFMKTLDPTTGVRENEVGMIEGAGGTLAGMAGIWNTAIGAGGMTEKVFREIVTTAKGLSNSATISVATQVEGYLGAYGERLPVNRVESLLARVPKPFDIERVTAEQLQAEAQAAIDNGADPDKVNARLQADLENLNG